MKDYLLVNIDRCWGCKSCMVACKKGHGILPGSLSFISVFRVENMKEDKNVVCDFIPVLCQHCSDAICIKKCPKKAIDRRKDGTVVISRSLCVGCGLCAASCPYGAISMERNGDDSHSYPYKCDLCFSHRERGAQTYCEQHCPGGVFTSLSEDAIKEEEKKYRYIYSAGQVVYASNVIDFNSQF